MRVECFVQLGCALKNNSVVQLLVSENGGAYSAVTEGAALGPQVSDVLVAAFPTIIFQRTVGAGGTYGIKVQSKAQDNGTSSSAQVLSLRAMAIRP